VFVFWFGRCVRYVADVNVESAKHAEPTTPPTDEETGDVERFRSRAEQWLREHKDVAPPDYGAILPPGLFDLGVAWQKLIYASGFAGIDWPREFGGQGLSHQHRAAWVRECALAGVPPFINMVGIVLAGGSTLAFGTEQQKHEHLHPTLAGNRVWCQLFSEPGAGSDLGSLSTKALQDGDSYIISGQKVWCSGGRYSDWGILMARTDSTAPKHRGISFFLFDMRLPGVTIRPLKQMTGEEEFDEVFFDDVRIPASCLLGPLNGGWMVGMATLTNERGSIGTASISLGRRMDSLLGHIRAAASNSPDGLAPMQRDQLMRLYSEGRTLTMLGQRQGAVASTASSLLKLGITELMFHTAETRTNLAGTQAMLADNDAAQSLLAAPGGRIAGGTSQIQRNLIGERLLGLPPEPKPNANG
jgi:alkylation response protein AidB-like acyl-CoA dehydrogenase